MGLTSAPPFLQTQFPATNLTRMHLSSTLRFLRDHPPLAILAVLVALSIFSRVYLMLS
jgi:hypothetical protein